MPYWCQIATEIIPIQMNLPEERARETFCLANARLVLPDQVVSGYLVVQEGEISEICEGTQVPDGAVDCAGDHVIPGLIELHTDNLERHLEPRPAVWWPHKAAILAHDAEMASTGITTVFDALRVGFFEQGKDRHLALARKVASEIIQVREAGGLRISHFLHLRAEICCETLEMEMAEFGPDDGIGIVSLMDHTPGQRQFRDLQALRIYLAKKRSMDDAEFQSHVLHLKTLQGRFREKHEEAAVAAAQRYGAVLASHDDTTLEHVNVSKHCGVRFAEFPTTFEAAAASREQGIAVMMGAPNLMRGESHSGNVSARKLAEEDLLDIVSSDYIPAALLLAAFYLADQWQDLPKAIACVTENPARVVRLTDRGRLARGLRADLVRVGMLDSMPIVRGVWCQGHRVG